MVIRVLHTASYSCKFWILFSGSPETGRNFYLTGDQPHSQDFTIPFSKEKDIEAKLTGGVVSLCTDRLRNRVSFPDVF